MTNSGTSTNTTDTVAAELRAAREEILTAMDRQRREMTQAITPEGGPRDSVDVASADKDAIVLQTLSESETRTLARIEVALDRIEAGTYGVCADCERPIPAARLAAMPASVLCVECRQAHEEQAG
ncbi:TraR/DksA family transcriptional regulator (plasmid) [Streptomyces sp. BI20]|uniref:TraR/DksA family transcriptional regulator n=1 Tax=Streptomyces sp. BI20 TaxID=3403460 RepID=UPI003C70D04D